MTVGQLLSHLEGMPRNAEVLISYGADTETHRVNRFKKMYSGAVMLESDELMCMDGFYAMGDAILETLPDDDIDRGRWEDFLEC